VYDTIQAINPAIIFGVSPFGIWTTQTAVATARGLTLPSGITGSDMYEQIYCDPVAWLQQGKVDYISPQLYWTTTSTGQDYKKLCPWWSDVAYKFSKYFYSSMSMSALASTYQAPSLKTGYSVGEINSELPEFKIYSSNGQILSGLTNLEQKIAQSIEFADTEAGLEIDWNRNSTKNAAPGAVLYSIKNLQTKGKFTKYLREQKFTSPALTPSINWKSHATLTSPTNIQLNGTVLSWNSLASNIRFSVYAVPTAEVGTLTAFTNVSNLLGVSYSTQFNLANYTRLFASRTFAVGALDRYGNEFSPVYLTTSVENVADNTFYSVKNRVLQIQSTSSSVIELYFINGTLIEKGYRKGLYEIELNHGMYLLRINGKIHKIII
jgi:hypothetical protein